MTIDYRYYNMTTGRINVRTNTEYNYHNNAVIYYYPKKQTGKVKRHKKAPPKQHYDADDFMVMVMR
jgi:hypothetical protein